MCKMHVLVEPCKLFSPRTWNGQQASHGYIWATGLHCQWGQRISLACNLLPLCLFLPFIVLLCSSFTSTSPLFLLPTCLYICSHLPSCLVAYSPLTLRSLWRNGEILCYRCFFIVLTCNIFKTISELCHSWTSIKGPCLDVSSHSEDHD